jgi:hypothetical protein
MKRMAWLLPAVLCSAVLLHAAEPKGKNDEAGKGKQMSGWICDNKCVINKGTKASCQKGCSATGPDVVVVFIDSKGTVTKVDNKDMAMPMMGKKVKIKAEMKGEMMYVYEIAPATY